MRLRWKLWASVALAGGLGATLASCAMMGPKMRPAQDLQAPKDAATVARGKQLVDGTFGCLHCHTTLGPDHMLNQAELGAGSRAWGPADDFPGQLASTNLTPDPETGLGQWSDGEIVRAMREGVSKDGHALFPLMPYPNYRVVPDADALAVVAYLRTLKPVKKAPPKRALDFPLEIIVNMMPKPLSGPVGDAPATDQPVARGAYLARVASCGDCHSPQGAKGPDLTHYLEGSPNFKADGAPHPVPGVTADHLASWTDDQVAAAIQTGTAPGGRRLSPVMPWEAYAAMPKEDMKALVAFLRTVKPGGAQAPKLDE